MTGDRNVHGRSEDRDMAERLRERIRTWHRADACSVAGRLREIAKDLDYLLQEAARLLETMSRE